jgi:hypothetical protein
LAVRRVEDLERVCSSDIDRVWFMIAAGVMRVPARVRDGVVVNE